MSVRTLPGLSTLICFRERYPCGRRLSEVGAVTRGAAFRSPGEVRNRLCFAQRRNNFGAMWFIGLSLPVAVRLRIFPRLRCALEAFAPVVPGGLVIALPSRILVGARGAQP